MASLLEKVSTLISANLNYLVNQALKSNSMVVKDQYIRQVSDDMEDMKDAAATVRDEVKSIKRKLFDQEQKKNEQDRAIDAFILEDNETSATAAQNKLNSIQGVSDRLDSNILSFIN
ncbi:MAG: PspA/IM30 family protein [bacterium]